MSITLGTKNYYILISFYFVRSFINGWSLRGYVLINDISRATARKTLPFVFLRYSSEILLKRLTVILLILLYCCIIIVSSKNRISKKNRSNARKQGQIFFLSFKTSLSVKGNLDVHHRSSIIIVLTYCMFFRNSLIPKRDGKMKRFLPGPS